MSRKLFCLLQLFVSAGLITWVVARVPAEVWRQLLDANCGWFAVACAGLFTSLAVGALRLHRLLRRSLPTTGYPLFLKGTLIGYFCSSFLPASVGGDVVKLAWLGRKTGNLHACLAGMLVERCISLLVTAIMLVASLSLISQRIVVFPALPAVSGPRIWGTGLLFVAAAAGAVLLIRSSPLVAKKIRIFFRNTLEALRAWHGCSGAVLECAGWSAVVLVLVAGACLCPLTWAVGSSLGVAEAAAGILLVTLVSLVPVSINGLGVYDASLTAFLHLVGLPLGQAAKIAVLMRITILIAGLPGAFLFLKIRKLDRKVSPPA